MVIGTKPGLAAVGSATVAVLSQSSGIAAMRRGHVVYNNCALYMLLYKQCRGFYCCSKREVNARSVFQEHNLVVCLSVVFKIVLSAAQK